MGRFKIELCSPPDRECLVAHIFIDGIQWAELNQENEELSLEIYPRPDGNVWVIKHALVLEALHEAKARLRLA